ncbi:MAG: tRNA uridine-5-carboxymethylaminomethyl(34) synthesis GTPase MnmE [Desulfobacterales bacterium]|nr:MAG: tRNA uridine-5-carboxymethylaminomethyl(34) synthesis GTPase MnmE [Desulfobacterales bacterium]
MFDTTIVAISTPIGPGGIGVIRISGENALDILLNLFVRKSDPTSKTERTPQNIIKSHRLYYGFIVDHISAEVIDEVLAVYMQAPKSFTREDIVEIHSHSGYVVLNRILSLIVDNGAELAGPGEFTKRAFLNGRIDLSQAEAIIDIINAPSEKAAAIASRQIQGGIRQLTTQLMDDIGSLRAIIEADLEFFEINESKRIRNSIEEGFIPTIENLIERQKETEIYKEGRLIAIIGSPNVGKSSLLNRLVERETAIVSDIPGTTRDLVKDFISINGVPIELCDTAGIHSTEDPIETIGIERSKTQIDLADIVLMVVESSRSLLVSEFEMLDKIPIEKLVVVVNKDDLASDYKKNDIEKKLSRFRLTRVSAKTGFGVDALKKLIFNEITMHQQQSGKTETVPNLRQRKILEKVANELKNALGMIDNNMPNELIAESLKNAQRLLAEISGKTGEEEIYEKIFQQFCVGK